MTDCATQHGTCMHAGELIEHTHDDTGRTCRLATCGHWLRSGATLSPDAECPRDDHRKTAPDLEADGYAWPDVTGDRPATVLLEAQAAVYGEREADYGHPREDFTRQAILWTGLLNHKLAEGAYIEADDIGRCMIAVKLARDVHSPKRDNRVDIAGYAATLDRLETGR